MKDIKNILSIAEEKLKNLSNPKLEAEVLLASVLKKERIFFKTHSEFLVNKNAEEKFFKCIDLRKKNIPVAYILGYKDWAGLRILVDKNTLIPRDETELLCHHILEKNKKITEKIKILDVGTGSGCISIFMKKKFIKSEVTALDISLKALNIAQKNAQNYHLKINFLESDMLQEISENSFFNIIIANLPYVPENINITQEVEKEPHSAIFSKNKGLYHIEKLKKQLETKNIQYSQLWLEFLPQQKKDIQNIFQNQKINFYGDISGQIFFACIG